MATQRVDLAKLFGTVASTLVQNKDTLNQADSYNHDHGDNMVQIFEVITQAMKEKKTATPAAQLAYASQLLNAKTQSGSAKLYAEGLSNASSQFKGKKVITPNSAMTLIQTLLGAQNPIPTSAAENTPSTGGADLLGSLLGGLTGDTQQTDQQPGQIDIGKIVNAGMAFAQAKGAGGSNLDAIMSALMSSSSMANSQHRSQSGALVANTLMQALGAMAAK